MPRFKQELEKWKNMELKINKAIRCKDTTSNSGSPWTLEDGRKGCKSTAMCFPVLFDAVSLALAVSKLMGCWSGCTVCFVPFLWLTTALPCTRLQGIYIYTHIHTYTLICIGFLIACGPTILQKIQLLLETDLRLICSVSAYIANAKMKGISHLGNHLQPSEQQPLEEACCHAGWSLPGPAIQPPLGKPWLSQESPSSYSYA